MAERRMFAKTIIDSDAFLDMPLSTQALYFHLSMRADDDGFVNNPKKIQRMIGGSDDDLRLLIAKNFIIPFESGVVVIKHWKIHNYIRSDRYKETTYVDEKSMLYEKDNKAYTLNDTGMTLGIPDGYHLDTQDRLGKESIDKDNKEEDREEPKKEEKKKKTKKKSDPVRHRYGEYRHVLLTDTQYQKLVEDYGETALLEGIKNVDEYCEEHNKSYSNYNLTLRRWGIKAPKLPKPTKEAKKNPYEGCDKVVVLLEDESNWDEYEADRRAHTGCSMSDGYWIK